MVNDENALFVLTFLVYSLTILPILSPNEASHFALAKTILFDHSFGIGAYSKFVRIDLSDFHGEIFSTMAPGLSFLLIPPLFLGTILGGLVNQSISLLGPGIYATPGQVLAVQSFSAACSAISVIYLYRFCLKLGAQRYSALATGIVYAFATPLWVFGKTQFPHSYSALFLIASYYYLLSSQGGLAKRNVLISAILAALSITIEYTNLVLILPEIVYMVVRLQSEFRSLLSRLLNFLVPIALSGLALLLYNYELFGNPLTFPEDYWIAYAPGSAGALSQFTTPIFTGLAGLLISSSRGLLVFSPIVLLAIPGAYLLVWKRGVKLETFVLVSVFLLQLLVYSKWDLWYGGASYGPRFLVTALPFLIVPVSAFFDSLQSWRSTRTRVTGVVLTFALLVWSVTIESIGAITSPDALYSSAPFFQFLRLDTGFLEIPEAKLLDLGFFPFFHNSTPPPFAGIVFWIFVISVPVTAFSYVTLRMNVFSESRLTEQEVAKSEGLPLRLQSE